MHRLKSSFIKYKNTLIHAIRTRILFRLSIIIVKYKKALINMTRTGIIVCSSIIIFCLSLIIFADYTTNKTAKPYIYDTVDHLPTCKAGLLLGTSKSLKSGHLNLFFAYRINAAVRLYASGKIEHVVISGDHSRLDYNEPQDMKDALVKRGIPSDKITLDYAGFNTYDSVHRMDAIFSQNEFILISQKFHNQRAIYIARSIGLTAYGYNAQDVNMSIGFKVQLREKLARVKMLLDLLVNRSPKFLGDKIAIE